MPKQDKLRIQTLGEALTDSPLKLSTQLGDEVANFVPDEARVLASIETRAGKSPDTKGVRPAHDHDQG